MNKEIYIALCDRLTLLVPALKWIDFDYGQIDSQAERPPVAFPACLIDVAYQTCSDQAGTDQLVKANITLRLAFDRTGETYHKSPVRSAALAVLNVLATVHAAMQGWNSAGAFAPLSRVSAQRERRRDGLQVFRVTYTTDFEEVI
jgi:hypothetical protein